MRKLLLFVLITLAGFALPANADWRRWLWYDPLLSEVGGNHRMLADLNYQYQINRMAAGLTPRFYPGGSHLYAGGYRGESGQPIGRTERTIETTAACAAIGAAAGGLKGLLYGAGGCLAGNVLYDVVSGRKVRKLREAEARMIQAQTEEREAKVQRETEEARQRANREAANEAKYAERDRRGGFHKNLTPFPIRFTCGGVDEVINHDRRVWLPEPSCNGGYAVQVLEPSGDMPGVREGRELGDGRFRSAISEDGRGWVYYYERPTHRGGAR